MTTESASPTAGAIDGPRWRPSTVLSITIMGGLLVALSAMAVTGQPGELGGRLNQEFGGWLPFFVSIQFLVLTPLFFALEHFLPARPEQRGFSPSVAYDALYMIVHLPAIVAIAAVLSGPISRFLENNAGWLVVDSTDVLPIWLMGLIGLAIGDFFTWFVHLLKHKVPLFWRFHMVHHSQPRMSMFTANRTHPVDALIDVFVKLVPAFILFPSFAQHVGAVFVFGFFAAWTERFQHTNVRTNLGPLRWIFVTPQSHRIHHSTEPEHWNSNYAAVFAWDRLFGTQHADVTTYPTTGINDPYFPEPKRLSVSEFARSFVGQMLFPFDRAAVRRASVGSPNDPTPAAEGG